jgi:hypothetical protein
MKYAVKLRAHAVGAETVVWFFEAESRWQAASKAKIDADGVWEHGGYDILDVDESPDAAKSGDEKSE